jgi:hypothetical protein
MHADAGAGEIGIEASPSGRNHAGAKQDGLVDQRFDHLAAGGIGIELH